MTNINELPLAATCQICGQDDDPTTGSTWRTDITGLPRAGNVCHECQRAYRKTGLRGEDLRVVMQALRRYGAGDPDYIGPYGCRGLGYWKQLLEAGRQETGLKGWALRDYIRRLYGASHRDEK